MAKLLIILVAFLILSVAGLYMLNEAFKQMDLDIFSGFVVFFSSFSPGETASPSLESSQTQIDTTTYNHFFNEKSEMEQRLEEAEPLIEDINNDTDITSTLRTALGNYYSAYVFTYVSEPIRMKIFEWSITVEHGLVTVFESGKADDSPSLEVEIKHTLVQQIMEGDVNQTDVFEWIESGSIRIRPVFEVLKLLQLLPVVTEYFEGQ